MSRSLHWILLAAATAGFTPLAAAQGLVPTNAGKAFRAFGDPRVWLIDTRGFRRLVPDMKVFQGCGLSPSRVTDLPRETIEAVEAGPQLDAIGCLAILRAVADSKPRPDLAGQALRSTGSPLVWFIGRSGQRQHVVTYDIFTKCGITAVRDLPPGLVETITPGPSLDTVESCLGARELIGLAPGTLFKEPTTPNVYMLDAAGAKRFIASWDVFSGCRLNLGAVRTLQRTAVYTLPDGPRLNTAGDCLALVNSLAPKPAAQAAPTPAPQQIVLGGVKATVVTPATTPTQAYRTTAPALPFGGDTATVLGKLNTLPERYMPPKPQGGNYLLKVHNLCRDPHSIAIKNDQTGQYQTLAMGKADAEIYPNENRLFALNGTVFWAHWSGRPHLGQRVQGAGELFLMPSGSGCELAFGLPAFLTAQAAQASTGRKLIVRNQCADNQSIAVKNVDNGVYQTLGGNSDFSSNRNQQQEFMLNGNRFWGHWSGRTDLGIEWSGSGMLVIDTGGTPCRLRFEPMAEPVPGNLRLSSQLHRVDAATTARNFARLLEIYNVPNVQPTASEHKLIEEFTGYINAQRLRAARVALDQYREWKAMEATHSQYCADTIETTHGYTYTPRQYGDKTAYCFFLPRGSRPMLQDLFSAGTQPPDDFKNLAIAGTPLLSARQSQELHRYMAQFGTALTTAVAGVTTVAAVSSSASLSATVIAHVLPFVNRVIFVATSAASSAATSAGVAAGTGGAVGSAVSASVAGATGAGAGAGAGAGTAAAPLVATAAGAIAVPLVVFAIATQVALPVMFTAISVQNYENDLLQVLDRYQHSSFDLAAAMRSAEGQNAVLVHLTSFAGGF